MIYTSVHLSDPVWDPFVEWKFLYMLPYSHKLFDCAPRDIALCTRNQSGLMSDWGSDTASSSPSIHSSRSSRRISWRGRCDRDRISLLVFLNIVPGRVYANACVPYSWRFIIFMYLMRGFSFGRNPTYFASKLDSAYCSQHWPDLDGCPEYWGVLSSW